MLIWIALSAWLLIFGIFILILQNQVKKKETVKKRMANIAGLGIDGNEKDITAAAEPKTPQEKVLFLIKKVSGRFDNAKESEAAAVMDLKMQQADLPLLGIEFLVLWVIVGVAAAVVTGILTLNLGAAIGAAGGAMTIVYLMLSMSIKRRRKAFNNQLGDMLNMVANALRAGFSFLQAFELVAKEMDDPVKAEVNKVVRDIGVGISIEKALEGMNKRICSPEFELVVTAVLIQRQVGGNMAQILDNISNTINERIRMRREVMALTAQGRASGMVLAALPFGAGILLSTINPGYLDPLFASDLGRKAIVGAIIMEILGWLAIEKIVNIDM